MPIEILSTLLYGLSIGCALTWLFGPLISDGAVFEPIPQVLFTAFTGFLMLMLLPSMDDQSDRHFLMLFTTCLWLFVSLVAVIRLCWTHWTQRQSNRNP